MPGTSIAQGELRLVGKVHGADNYVLTWYDDPDDWEFKQFVSQEQLDKFVAENNLILVEQRNDNSDTV